MNLLIIGGAGYIGGVTARLAQENNHTVTVFDNLSSGLIKNISSDTDFIEGDVNRLEDVRKAFEHKTYDAVLHFAAKILVPESMIEPYEYIRVNSFGVLNVVDQAVRAGIKNYVLSSTAAVYGAPTSSPIDEGFTLQPVNPYGESKLIAERILASYEHSFNLNWLALRYFNVAGAYAGIGPDYPFISHVIPALLDRAYKKSTFVINGSDYDTPDGTCIRDFVHVKDIARAHVMAVERMADRALFRKGVNLGSATGYSVKEITDAFMNITKKSLDVSYGSRRSGDPDRLVASSELAKKLIGWIPQCTLEQIITDHALWYDALAPDARVKSITTT